MSHEWGPCVRHDARTCAVCALYRENALKSRVAALEEALREAWNCVDRIGKKAPWKATENEARALSGRIAALLAPPENETREER